MTRKANSQRETEGSNHREYRGDKEKSNFVSYAFFAVKPDRDSEVLDFRATSELLRRALFEAQDDIDRRREQLIAEIEGKLQQRVSQEKLFSIRWSLE